MRASARTHHEAVVEAGEDGAGEGDGGELEVAEVAGEGLHDDVEAVGGQGRTGKFEGHVRNNGLDPSDLV